MPWLEQRNPPIDWIKKTVDLNANSTRNEPTHDEATPYVPTPDESTPNESTNRPRRPQKVRRTTMVTLPEKAPHKPPNETRPTIGLTTHINPGDQVFLAIYHWDTHTLSATLEGPAEDEQQPVKIPPEYEDLSKVFSESLANQLPPHRGHLDHSIPLEEGAKPTFGPIYNLSETELEVLKEYIETNLEKGFIRPSSSPYGAPVLFIKKPHGGGLRLCVDYRALNRVTIKNRYPLPLITELFDRLRKAKYFSKLDLRAAYHLIRVALGEEWKTAFRTRYGHFEYLVMPFGLTNAPATFQSYINTALRTALDKFSIAFIDDILVYSETLEEHIQHVRQILQILLDHGLYVSLEKCKFHVQEVNFLGFLITPNGIAMEPERVATINEWPVPTSLLDIQVFLGFCNFYRRFIKAYSRVALPITALLRKGSRPFDWTEQAQHAFEQLKRLFTQAPILRHFDPTLPIYLYTDASGFAISAILCQKDERDLLHPVAFWSRKSNPAECNYDIHDTEMLAIVSAFQHWRHYLEGASHTVTVYTDHKNLEVFMSTKVLNRRQARWAELLAGYDFVLAHTPGTKNPADGPSRRPDYAKGVELPVGMLLPPSSHPTPAPNDATHTMPTQVHSALTKSMHNTNRTTSNAQHTTPNAIRSGTDKSEPGPDSTLARMSAGTLYRLNTTLTTHMPDATLHRRFTKHLGSDALAQAQSPPTTPYRWEDGLLLHHTFIYVPEALRLDLLRMHHDDPLAGHFGVHRTLELLSRNYWFPSMAAYVRDYVGTCDLCMRGKPSRHRKHGELMPLPVPAGPWKGLSCDFITDLPPSNHHDALLVFVDRFTKMTHLVPCNKTTDAPEFAHLFVDHIVRLHGLPESIVSDRGSIFTSHFWTALSKLLKVKGRLSTAFHPQTDGQTERMNQTIEQYLRIYCNYQQDNWYTLLSLAEFAYNNAYQSTIKCSPFFANYGFNPSFHIDLRTTPTHNVPAAKEYAERLVRHHDSLIENVKHAQDSQARYYDSHHERIEFSVGDHVWLLSTNLHTERQSKKLDWKRLGPFQIIERIGLQAYRLALPPRMKIHPVFHISLLELHRRSTIPGRSQPPPPPVVIEDELEWEVEEILDSKHIRRHLHYKVRWTGHPPSDDSWEPAPNLKNAPDRVNAFHLRYPSKPR